ncbi:hypothetical protein TKK_0011822 [Trichogramma kaykai]|uniref:MYND-type domain-containing protein n=1 Tax=Trichogramma kaykai TaxID=54128 RepID=A0ABD2WPY1_9HYME
MELEKKSIIDAFAANREKFSAVLSSEQKGDEKSSKSSKEWRQKGNELYTKSSHEAPVHKEIFINYTKSILFAPNDSEELALGYGNRSAFLLHIEKYQDCINDVDKALKITSSKSMKVKLLCRKAECLKHLKVSEFQNALNEAKSVLNDDDLEAKRNLDKVIERINNIQIKDEKKEENDNNDVAMNKEIESNVLDSVTIRYNNKYGRHLTANKDYNPGDIIYIEKMYSTVLDVTKRFTNCAYCLKRSWSGIPCENCCWTMYCSEDCKEKSLVEHHDIECSLIPQIEAENYGFLSCFHICLRVLLKGLKENNMHIEQMKSKLRKTDKNETPYRGFMDNSTFNMNTFSAVYSLKSNEIPSYILEQLAFNAWVIILHLIKNTSLFGEAKMYNKIEQLIKNEDVLFLGSIFTKLCIIKYNNNYDLSGKLDICENMHDQEICRSVACCKKGTGLGTLTSLINHSCFPNAAFCFTEDSKLIIYACLPIKKDSQIFISYGLLYYDVEYEERQSFLRKYYFNCDCEACSGNWPQVLLSPEKYEDEILITNLSSDEEKTLKEQCKKVFKILQQVSDSFDSFKLRIVSSAITKAFSNLKQPSLITSCLIESLHKGFAFIFEAKQHLFGQCVEEKK